jgi:hypothetical protein
MHEDQGMLYGPEYTRPGSRMGRQSRRMIAAGRTSGSPGTPDGIPCVNYADS